MKCHQKGLYVIDQLLQSVHFVNHMVYKLFQGEAMDTFWLEGREGGPEFDLEAAF